MSKRVRSIAEISARVFKNVVVPPGPGTRSPTKYAKKGLQGPARLEWWAESPDRNYALNRTLRALGLYQDESRDWREEQLQNFIDRGKILTKKGEGKRKGKKKR
mmetsp:Transcript_4000/g.10082  ORF Transcript_4000/g.10082 Transcript_4000/m.10082 type:complete len:104 (+) Transcript_4000:58-369(+)